MYIGSIVCVGSRVYVGLIQGLYEYRCIEGHRFIPASQGVSVYGFRCRRVYAGLRVWGYRWLWGHAGYVFKYIGFGSMDQAGKGVDTYSRSCRRAAEAADACSCFRFAEDAQRARSMQTCCIM